MVPNVVSNATLPRRRRRACVIAQIAGSLLAAACSSDAPTVVAGPPAVLQQVSGDGQSAPPGAALERPLVTRLLDSDGHPVRRVEVRWSATAGQVAPAVSTTDAKGEARATWQLGTTTGPQRATAQADGLPPVDFVAYVDPKALPDRIALRALSLTTYDGSGQVVHPDVAISPAPEFDGQARLVITPYPWGNANFENPSLFSGDRETWRVPQGITNPIVRPETGYFSDPDVVWVEDRRELWLYYRQVTDENRILVTRSADGVHWSASHVVVRAPNHAAVSPTIVRRSPTDWRMWTVNSGPVGCGSSSTTVEMRTSADGTTWSPPTTVALSQPGVFAWHLEVQWIPALGEYWAVFNGKVSGSCTTEALYLATSADGLTWRTYRSPVLRRGAVPEFADVVYRGTFAYDAERDAVSFWHSGARFASRGYEWHAVFERRPRAMLFDDIARAPVAAAAAVPTPSPPLTNVTAP